MLFALFVGAAVMYYKKTFPCSLQAFEFNITKNEHLEKININKATKEELARIKGVGSVLAGRIISYREKWGYFRKVEDIKNIKGIGGKTYEKIKEQVALE